MRINSDSQRLVNGQISVPPLPDNTPFDPEAVQDFASLSGTRTRNTIRMKDKGQEY